MKKKTLIMLLCSMLVVYSAATETIAYLTAWQSISNVFTVGNVQIFVDETKVNTDGKPVNANGEVVELEEAVKTTDGNLYHLIPGQSYVKDPTITVCKGSEETYMRMMVEITNYKEVCDVVKAATGEEFAPHKYVTGYDGNVWEWTTTTVDEAADAGYYEFRYCQTVNTQEATEDLVLPSLFKTIEVPQELKVEQMAALEKMKINITGQAIQAATFANADEAWNAFVKQTTPAPAPGSGV